MHAVNKNFAGHSSTMSDVIQSIKLALSNVEKCYCLLPEGRYQELKLNKAAGNDASWRQVQRFIRFCYYVPQLLLLSLWRVPVRRNGEPQQYHSEDKFYQLPISPFSPR